MAETLGRNVHPESITLTGLNPRKDFDETSLKELAESIKAHGIIEPLVVRPGGKRKYELVAGERRLRAARMLKMDQVPVVVREYSDEQIQEVMLLENLQRQDLSPLEEARALRALLERTGMNQEDLAKRIGMSRPWVSRRVRLLDLPEDALKLLEEEQIGPEVALMLVPFIGTAAVNQMVREYKEVVDYHGGLTVKRAEREVEKVLDNPTYAMNLDSPPWSVREVWEQADTKACESCDTPITVTMSGNEYRSESTERYCLDTKCFKRKVREAKKKIKERGAAAAEKAHAKLGKNEVDLRRLGYGAYEKLSPGTHYGAAMFDLKECEGCEHRKTGVNGDEKRLVCLKPSCFNEKNRKAQWERESMNRRLEKQVRHNLETTLEELTKESSEEFSPAEVADVYKIVHVDEDVLRLLLYEAVVGSRVDGEVLELALKPWAAKKPKKGWKAAIAKVPAEDLPRALLAVTIHASIERGRWDDDADWRDIRKAMPRLFRGQLPDDINIPMTCPGGRFRCFTNCEFFDPDVGCTYEEASDDDMPIEWERCPAEEVSEANGMTYCGDDETGSVCIKEPASVGSAFECPRGRPRVYCNRIDTEDIEDELIEPGILCDPGAYEECVGCSSYGCDESPEEEPVTEAVKAPITKTQAAYDALQRMLGDKGEDYIRTQASGGLQCAMRTYLEGTEYEGKSHLISEGVINTARRRLLQDLDEELPHVGENEEPSLEANGGEPEGVE